MRFATSKEILQVENRCETVDEDDSDDEMIIPHVAKASVEGWDMQME